MSREKRVPLLVAVRAPPQNTGRLFSLLGSIRKRQGVPTYAVLSETQPKPIERRAETRRSARLQSGKVLNQQDQFLTEFSFRNRTSVGVQLRLAKRVCLPKLVKLYDDSGDALIAARVVWQRGADVGCRIKCASLVASEKLRSRLRGRYYAVE